MSTYEHTVKMRQKEDAKKSEMSAFNNQTNKGTKNSIQLNGKLSTISSKIESPPLDIKQENLPKLNIENESGGILPSLPPLSQLPPLKNNPRIRNNTTDQVYDNKAFDLHEINTSINDKSFKSLNTSSNNHILSLDHTLPCIMPNKHYLELNSDSRDSSTFHTNRTDVDFTESTYQSMQTNTNSNEKRTSNIIKLPKLQDDTRATISSLSSNLESKRRQRKQLIHLSTSPPNLSNRSTPESKHENGNVKYLNSSNLKKLDSNFANRSSNELENSTDFRTLKSYTPSSDSDDDIVIGNKQFNKSIKA